MSVTSVFKLLSSLALTLAVGATAGRFTAAAIPDWYATLNKPSFNPPNWLFAPVWTALYVVLGVSLFLIWTLPPDRARKYALTAFSVQLFLNFSWSFLFFYFKTIGLALAEIIVLWVTIIVMIILFRNARPVAAYINIPYLLWVSFAAILNAAYYMLN